MTDTITIECLPDGRVAFLHADELVDLIAAAGDEIDAVDLFRASHVEPSGRGWTADLTPVGGPVLGPFRLRGDALRAEREWLEPRLAGIVEGRRSA